MIAKTRGRDTPLKTYNFFKGDYDQMREGVNLLGWEKLTDTRDVNYVWERLKMDLLDLTERFVNKRSNKTLKCQWMNKKADKARLAKKEAWNAFSRSGRDERLYDFYQEKLRTSVKEIRHAKLQYEHKLSNEIKTNPKNFYSYINSKSRVQNKVGPFKTA